MADSKETSAMKLEVESVEDSMPQRAKSKSLESLGDKKEEMKPPADMARSHSDIALDSPKLARTKTSDCPESPNPSQAKYVRHSSKTKFIRSENSSKEPVSHTERGRKMASGAGRAARSKKASGTTSHQKSKSSSMARSKSIPGDKKPSRNSVLTDYFPVRRSARMSSSELKNQILKEVENAVLENREDGLEVVDFDGKGRGVVATKPFRRGEFVVEYAGDLIEKNKAERREKMYSANPEFGCYMYYFVFRNKTYCVDATTESGRLGRLLNHSKTSGNCMTKVIGIGDRPYLILVAARDISTGEELLYDYGDRSKSSLDAHPWLAR